MKEPLKRAGARLGSWTRRTGRCLTPSSSSLNGSRRPGSRWCTASGCVPGTQFTEDTASDALDVRLTGDKGAARGHLGASFGHSQCAAMELRMVKHCICIEADARPGNPV